MLRVMLLAALASGCIEPPMGDDAPRGAPYPDTVVAVVHASMGTADGPEESLFGDVTSVAADSEGRVYVADRIGSSIRAFGADGTFLGWVGREGGGPGEFQWPNDIFVAPDQGLYVRDRDRITRLVASAASLFPDSVVDTWRLPGYANLDSRRGRLAGQDYLYPDYSFRRDQPPRFFYLRFGPDGFTGDTVHVPQIANLRSNMTAFYRTGPGGGRMVEGLSSGPFAPRASWDITSFGSVLASEGDRYLVREYSKSGDVIRSMGRPNAAPLKVPESERRDSLAALAARIDSLPVALEDVENVSPGILRSEFSDRLPSVLSVHWGVGDRVWIERWPPEGRGTSRVFDVHAYEGGFLATVVVPAPLLATPPPYFGEESVVGVVKDPRTDVHTVVVSTFALPSSELEK